MTVLPALLLIVGDPAALTTSDLAAPIYALNGDRRRALARYKGASG